MSETVEAALVLILKVLAFVADIITFVPYFIIQRPDRVLQKSNRVKVGYRYTEGMFVVYCIELAYLCCAFTSLKYSKLRTRIFILL